MRAQTDLDNPIEPPAQTGVTADRWRVTPEIELYHYPAGTDLALGALPILVVHGGPGWPNPGPWCADPYLGKQDALHCDLRRGSGRSTRPFARPVEGSTYEKIQHLHRNLGLPAQIADIARIRRILGRDKMLLIGHSVGAFLATSVCGRVPGACGVHGARRACAAGRVSPKHGDLFASIRAQLPSERL